MLLRFQEKINICKRKKNNDDILISSSKYGLCGHFYKMFGNCYTYEDVVVVY